MRDERVLAAMAHVPSEALSQPYVVAHMTEALQIGPADRVLEIGTGSGYAAAVLAEVAAEVHTVERHAELARRSWCG